MQGLGLLFLASMEYMLVQACVLSVSDSESPWTVSHPASLSMEFSRQEYFSGLLFPIPSDRPDSGIKPASLASPALAGGFFTISTT